MQNILISMPNQTDLIFLVDFAKRMKFLTKVLNSKEIDIVEMKLNQYMETSPENVGISVRLRLS